MPESSVALATRPPLWSVRKTLIYLGILVALVVLAYSDSFRVPFLLDDFESVVNNPTIRRLGDLRTVLSPPAGVGVGGRPILNLTYALDHAWAGLNATGYHATDLCIHLACAGFVFALLRRTLLRLVDPRFSARADFLAWCITALWALQPLQTISVTYISQRAESLMGLFFVAAMYCFVRSTNSVRSSQWQAGSFALLALGVLVKEQVAVAPLLFLLYDRAFLTGTFRRAWTARQKFYLSTVLLWVILGTSLVLAPRQQIGLQSVGSLGEYLLTDAEAVLRYVKLSIFPYPLIFDYGIQTAQNNALSWAMMGGASFLLALSFISLWRAPAMGFLGAWFFLILAPTTSVVPIRLQPIAENRAYLPSLAVIVAVVLAVVHRGGTRVLPFFACLALLGFLGTWSRNLDYRDELSLWKDTAEKRPTNARAHLNLGFALVRAGRVDDGIAEYHRALAVRPNFMRAHYNLGCVLLARKQIPEAVEELMKALSLQPTYAPIYNNLGFAQQELGQTAAAVETLRKGVALDPQGTEMNFNFGNSLLAAGKLDEAVEAYTRVIQLRSDLPDIYLQRGRALSGLHRFSEARADYGEALKRRPGWDLPAEELKKLN